MNKYIKPLRFQENTLTKENKMEGSVGDAAQYEELFERTVQGMVHGSYIPIPKIVKKKKKTKKKKKKTNESI